MISKQFTNNPTLHAMVYEGERLTITFKRSIGLQDRTYIGVPSNIAYALYYKQKAKDAISYFAKNIRKKFKVVSVNLKMR